MYYITNHTVFDLEVLHIFNMYASIETDLLRNTSLLIRQKIIKNSSSMIEQFIFKASWIFSDLFSRQKLCML